MPGEKGRPSQPPKVAGGLSVGCLMPADFVPFGSLPGFTRPGGALPSICRKAELGSISMMKTGFSSLVCPDWDLARVAEQASSLGFDGVELRGLQGELHLPLVPELASDPDGVLRLFQQQSVELVALSASATLDSYIAGELASQKATITEFIELASRLACPFVRIYLGEVPKGDLRQRALARIAEGVASLAPVAAQNRVTLLVEIGGDFPSSRDLWYVVDAARHPALRCCWNQCHALAVGERPTESIPRLGSKIGMVHVCDATFDENGILLEYKSLGGGHTQVARQVEFLKGLLYDGYLVFEWPKMWDDSLPEPDAVLPEVAKFLREQIEARQTVLSAYKGDKRPAKMAARRPAATGS